jgi:hypothetical protein
VAVGPKLNAGLGRLPVGVEEGGGKDDLGVVRGTFAPKLNPAAIGLEGVVDAASVVPLASLLFSGVPVLPKPKPNEADEVLGLGAKVNPAVAFGVGGRSELEPMLNENVGNLLGVVEAEAGVDGALKRKDEAPVLDGDGTTMLSEIAGFTVGLMAKMLDCF